MKANNNNRARMRKIRARYRKRMVIVAIVFLIIGIVLGAIGDRKFFNKPGEARVIEVMVTPTPTVEPDPTPIPTPEPTEVPEQDVEEPDLGAFDDGVEGDDFDEDFGEDFNEDFGDEGEFAEEGDFGEAGDAETVTEDAAEPEAQSMSIDMPTVAPTAEPTEAPTPEPTPAPTPVASDVIVPFGEAYEFSTQIKSDGKARIAASDEAYETVTFSLKMQSYMLPMDFADKWGTVYKLAGTEAGAGFELTLLNYTGVATIMPQNIIKIALVSESGTTENLGYQLMDAEISGNRDVTLQTNTPKTVWKRYDFTNSGDPMKYLAVTTYNNGVAQTIRFELVSDVAPTPNPLEKYITLTRGDKKDEVLDLQKRLIETGYLTGKADGNYGEKTQTAVRAAQKVFGMDETGTATPEFQAKLFEDTGSKETTEEAAQ